MVSALFTALALIAAGQGGSAPSGSAATQMGSNAMSAPAAPMPTDDRAAARKARRNG